MFRGRRSEFFPLYFLLGVLGTLKRGNHPDESQPYGNS